MKLIVAACLVILAVIQKIHGAAEPCVVEKCSIEKNCRCSQTDGPLAIEKTPQLIVLAFVDAAREDLYRNRWSPLVEPRTNPDGKFISATFYVPHEYSDYQIVHDLATIGFEIGVHSVTNNAHQTYWRNADQTLLEHEFGDQRKIISKFANIPIESVTGTLTPQLGLAGDNSIKAFTSKGFAYDNTLPSKVSLYPYTLDYATTQVCDTGAKCPEDSYPGFWMTPIIDLTADDGSLCATLASCFGSRNNQTSQEISDWLFGEVNKVKNTNRAPLTLVVEETLFNTVNESWVGVNDALDRLQQDKEIFFVSQARVLEWIKNPVPISEFTTNAQEIDSSCNKNTCKLTTLEGQTRYMVSCVACPKNYPWLENPEGN